MSRGGRRGLVALAALAALVTASVVAHSAYASHPLDSLPDSNFEIDVDANLKVDDASPSIDWASVNEERTEDEPTGSTDDSYGGGAKEDDLCPRVTTGNIPNNKSDLLTFGAYQEPEAAGPGFLHLFWTRVLEPSGTTLMDFELNQSSTDCGNGVNPVRTVGDLLIEYRIEQGGASATLMGREWNGSAWGPGQDLTAIGAATGTINESAIPAADSDALVMASNSLSPRTFGEMSLDLDFIFETGKCESFGSAFLKSRASTSFTSQLKDFIKPIEVSIASCGSVVIHKETSPPSDPETVSFDFTKNFPTDPATGGTFSLGDGESTGTSFAGNVLPGTGYTVAEDLASLPTGWEFDSVNCDDSENVDFTVSGAVVTFAIDSPTDVLECTYTNVQQQGAIKIAKTRKHADSETGVLPHAGVTFTVTGGELPAGGAAVVTDSNGEVCLDGLVLSSGVGDYTVTETVPSGYSADDPGATRTVSVTEEADCGDGIADAATATFSNTPLTDITVSVDSLIPGGTASTITCGTDEVTTDPSTGDGTLTLEDRLPGTYTCTVVIDP